MQGQMQGETIWILVDFSRFFSQKIKDQPASEEGAIDFK
jgi:hypothetical protein